MLSWGSAPVFCEQEQRVLYGPDKGSLILTHILVSTSKEVTQGRLLYRCQWNARFRPQGNDKFYVATNEMLDFAHKEMTSSKFMWLFFYFLYWKLLQSYFIWGNHNWEVEVHKTFTHISIQAMQ